METMPKRPQSSSIWEGETLFPPGFTRRDEANAIVAKAFRNGPLERLHCGEQSPLLEDPTLSRLTNAEIKELMTYASEVVEELLRWKETNPERYAVDILWFNTHYCGGWERSVDDTNEYPAPRRPPYSSS